MTAAGHDFDQLHRSGQAPWEIGGPQPALAALLDNTVRGPRVLDLGCGTGELAIALARHGHQVTGIDISPVAVEAARAKATGLSARFEVGDATRIDLPAFDTVIDCGLLHNLARTDDTAARDYVARLPQLTVPGGLLLVLAVAADAGRGWGLTPKYLQRCAAAPWWAGARVQPAEVVARDLTMPGLLLHATRT
ncbi:class I SAM-dependent methyltransferase [Symbioplanes lichenis]|uniref:class I SAM-dependent methyltransferase n=1 Tax=Symbioplanes lichenis TaxID=1629072 RepID=UPI0027389280|nr:class I SAM-dependent methyltransferase [Actinoplanes lichenis]